MVYDWENTPVSSVTVYIDNKKYIESDIQGRFVMEFKNPKDYTIKLSKKGYEDIEQVIQYDPMNVLYFKMVNVSQLVSLAENALDEKMYVEALSYLDRAIALEPSRPDAWYLKSITLYLQKKNEEAKEVLEYLMGNGINDAYITDLLRILQDENP
jgi:tetratricopeptide (TPR) repeat protein